MSKLTDVWDSFSEGETPEDAWDSVGNEDFQDVSLETESLKESADSFASNTADEILDEADDADDLEELLDEVDDTPRKRRGLFDDDDDDDEYDDDLDDEKRPRKKSGGILTIAVVVLAIAVIVCAVIFIAKKLSSNTSAGTETSETSDAEWEKNTNSDVLSLINKYYAARIQGDSYTLAEVLDPSITIDEETLMNEQNVVEGYQDIECHTTAGMDENSWAVYVTYGLKFKNISTPAPGLTPAYVYTDESGALKLIPGDFLSSNEKVNAYMSEVSKTEYVESLVSQVNDEYQKALASDSALNAYIVGLGGEGAETTSAESSSAATESTTATATTAATETTTASTTAAATTAASTTAASGSESFTDYDNEMFVTKDDVRVRSTPSTSSDDNIVKTLPKGQKVYTTGKSDNWYRISLADGSTAYIAKDYLSSDAPSTTSAN